MKNIIRNAGEILKEGFYNLQKYDQKEQGHLLSEYDIKVNSYIINEIQNKYPSDSIYSEESDEIQNKSNTTWVIDPIDGTSYFIFGEPYFSISVSKEMDNRIVEAHVYNPISNEYYYSDNKTNLSFLNDSIIKVSNIDNIKNSLVAFGFSANIKVINKYYNDWQYVFDNCKKGIAWICPALSICNVAKGRIEAFIDMGCSYEGQSAASLILKNAGGKLYNYDKTKYTYKTKGGIFTNRLLKI
jgi:fructose-1,6-bisphosphatase/inositol monophosphatase family enzyme